MKECPACGSTRLRECEDCGMVCAGCHRYVLGDEEQEC